VVLIILPKEFRCVELQPLMMRYSMCMRSSLTYLHLGQQNGITHAFVVEFESAADRDYYVNEDPVHQEFVRKVGKVLEKAQVIDFTDGVF
jgi:hypothetical protein